MTSKTPPAMSAAAHDDKVGSFTEIPNPAAQTAGPPDPIAQKAAAAAAEAAAQRAAELAPR